MDLEPKIVTSEEYNARVAAFGSDIGQMIRTNISMLTSKGKGELLKSFRMKTKQSFGEVDRITYHFERHGIFLHKGVGKGYSMVGGKLSRISRTSNNQNEKLSFKALTGSILKRKPIEWFNPIITGNMDKLADLIAEMRADQVVNATKILIK
jgi:hypothetical protein